MIIMKKFQKALITGVLLVLLGSSIQAQQDAQYSMYMFNSLVINPAYAGTRGATSVTGLFRKQWVGIQGAPLSASISWHGSDRTERNGFGASITEDNLGITNMIGVYGYYAYKVRLGPGKLSMGLLGGMLNYRNNWNSLKIKSQTDAAIPREIQNRFMPLVGAGLYYNTRLFYAGVSVPNVIPNRYSRFTVGFGQEDARQVVHVFATTGIAIEINQNLVLKPSILMKYAVRAPIEFDINFAVLLRQALWVGVSYRTRDAIVGMVEYDFVNGFRIGYAYDLTLTELAKVNTGSHEIMVGLDIRRSRNKFITPRYF